MDLKQVEFLKVPPFSYVVCNGRKLYVHIIIMYNGVYSLILYLAITTVHNR